MREKMVSDWLAGSDWAGWTRMPMTGDASARRYERLTGTNGSSVILMDAPPDSCGSQSGFVHIAAHLRGLSLAAPEILYFDDRLGLMVLEDLGATHFADHLAQSPQDERQLYEAAIDVLKSLQSATPPDGFTVMTPDVGTQMIDIAFNWAATDHSADLADQIKQGIEALLQEVSPKPSTLSLRDYHAENLIWRPDHTGAARVGLLDFQDAFVTHPAYDLASLLRDARRDVDPALTAPLLSYFGGDVEAAFHIFAVQRNLRILGILNRLARRDGKTGYLSLLPRVRAHLETDLAALALASVAPLIRSAFDLKGPTA